MTEIFKTRGKSLLQPYDNGQNFDPTASRLLQATTCRRSSREILPYNSIFQIADLISLTNVRFSEQIMPRTNILAYDFGAKWSLLLI